MTANDFELDDLRQAWSRMAARQDAMEARMHDDRVDRRCHDSRVALRRGMALRALELVAWVLFVVWAATFWVGHRHTPHLLAIGVMLHVYGIAAIWSAATQLLYTARIQRFDAPVTVLQRRLARLRRFRFVSTLLLGLPWWWLWLLLPLAVLTSLTGIDLYAAAPVWIWANLAFGTVGIAASLWLARHLSQRPTRSAFLQRIVDDMSGRSLLAASRSLEEIDRFERS